jgi:ligand-binding sensor domain-containing protein
LHVQNDTGYVSYTDGNIIEFNGISNIIHDSQNNIWIATQDYQDVRQGCLVKYDEDGFHNCFPNTHLGKPKLISFLNNKIYTYNNSPLSVFDYINWNIDITGTELFKTTTNSVCIDNLENTWIGTNDGLYKINSNESIEHIAELFGNEVSKVKCVGSFNNNVWVITSDNKFYKFDGAIWSEIEIPIGYSLNTATRIFVRNENEIWFTRSSRSAIKYNQNAWQIYDTTAGFLPNQNINDICFAGDSTWFATIYGAVLLYNDELSFHCNDSSFFSGYSYLQTVQVDKNGLVWFGNRKGAMAYNGETISYLQPTGSEAEIYSIREDPERNLWFCGENAVSKYTFDNSGVENSKAEQKFCKLFPNPASNLVNLELPVGVKQDVVQIFSTSGVMLISKTITDQTTQIDVSALKPGLYLLKFKNARIYGKLIIE